MKSKRFPFVLAVLALAHTAHAQPQTYHVESLALDGGADGEGGRIAIVATLGDPKGTDEEPKLIYALESESTVVLERESIRQSAGLTASVKHGKLKQLVLSVRGDLPIERVSGENVETWSLRRGTEGDGASLQLVVDLTEPVEEGTFSCEVTARSTEVSLPMRVEPLMFSPPDPKLLAGGLRIEAANTLSVEVDAVSQMTKAAVENGDALHRFTFRGGAPSLALRVGPKAGPGLAFRDFALRGRYDKGGFSFDLSGVVEVYNAGEHRLPFLSGEAALSAEPEIEGAALRFENGRYAGTFDGPGRYSVSLAFDAKVRTQAGRSSVDFELMDSVLQPVRLEGLPAGTGRVRLNGVPLDAEDGAFVGNLSGDGGFHLLWTDPSWRSPEPGDAALFYAVESVSRIRAGPGRLRQHTEYSIQVMQGAMRELDFVLEGDGEITQVEGDAILSWTVAEVDGERRLSLRLNEARTGDFPIVVRSREALGVFPAEARPLRAVPVDAIRYSGFIRIANEGAVAIDVPRSQGIAQISPEYFPGEDEAVPAGAQVLAYRFSDASYAYTVRAEDILPEVAVSQLLVYRIGPDDQSLQAEMELTIRKAPLRDFYLEVPDGFALSDLNAPALADYFLLGEGDGRELRIVFREPLLGRQVIRLSMENNRELDEGLWRVPSFGPKNVNSLRGHVGVATDPGLRVAVDVTSGLAEQAVNFFPKEVAGLQLALRLRESEWAASLAVERLPRAIQADALHLYTIGEGRVYGSSVINYLVSGAPVSAFRIRIPGGTENLDFVGRDVRGWSEVEEGVYEVRLHASASGAYTLLASYESKFEARGQKLSFTGAVPLDVVSERGFVVAISNFPFSVDEVAMSAGMIRLEPNEIPAEFRLLYGAQVLGAFQYGRRPMEVSMALKSFEQAEARDQVIDFAEFNTHISRDGEVLTAINLMLKSKGRTHFRMRLPQEHRIWSARVGGRKVNPVSVEGGILLPLPAGHPPDKALRVSLELAGESDDPNQLAVYAPALFAPSLMVDWKFTSDPGYGLRYVGGAIDSEAMSARDKGFDWLRSLLSGAQPVLRGFFIAMVLGGLAALVLARLLRAKFSEMRAFSRIFSVLVLLGLLGGVTLCGIILGEFPSASRGLQETISLQTPVELSNEPLQLAFVNRAFDGDSPGSVSWLPILLGLVLWAVAFAKPEQGSWLWPLGWLAVLFGALDSSGGPAFFLVVLILFFLVHVLRPFSGWFLSRGAMAGLALAAFLGMGIPGQTLEAESAGPGESVVAADRIVQRLAVEDGYANVRAELAWTAEAEERLVFLRAPATLVESGNPPEGLRLHQVRESGEIRYVLEAVEAGAYRLNFRYRVAATADAGGRRVLELPVGLALSHEAALLLPGANLAVDSPQAVTIRPEESSDDGRSRFSVVFSPSADGTRLTWAPERRDASKEEAVYYVESFDTYVPMAGLVAGHHGVQVRLSRGRLDALELATPGAMTITAVEAEHLASWRFDPGERRLMLYFDPVQSGRFELQLFSQYGASGLPYRAELRPPRVLGAAGQLSLAALATGDDVQIGEVEATEAAPINLEDFPGSRVGGIASFGKAPGIRRAYRWDAEAGALSVEALEVRPDIRSTIRQTASLGEDRVLLSLELNVEIKRAGVFKLSMPVPEGYDVETVSGQHLSHWNVRSAEDGTRALQLHLQSKTIGAAGLNLSLSGPGLADEARFTPPILRLAETDRQSGTLVLVPELGYRLQATEREAAVQLDPAEAGLRRNNVLLYRILNEEARLAFAVERVEPWIEVERLQSVVVRGGVIGVKARFNFEVENAGVRERRFRLPEGAVGVRFSGEAVNDAEAVGGNIWRVKLDRKMVGRFTLELAYRIPTPDQPDRVGIGSAEVLDVDQQSGYLALVPKGRIQLSPQSAGALQPAEAHMIEPRLRGELAVSEASHVYRLLEPAFELGVGITRHEIADFVPAQVREVRLTSVVSGDGAMLTRATLKLDPGDKRMLRIELPPESDFWFGFVNQQSAWPWREGEAILLQLESGPVEGEDAAVEFFYASKLPGADRRRIDTAIRGPRLDLPLENIAWNVFYPETWKVEEWGGNLIVDKSRSERGGFSGLGGYLKSERKSRLMKKSKAENLLDEANQLLELGKQEQARKAFSSAYNLSQSDEALNEDARVQLRNVREEQALVALANRRNVFINDNAGARQAAAPQMEVDDARLLNYTDKVVQGVLGGNTQEENETLRLLAARLIEQQQATPANPRAIHAILPEQGRTVAFSRSLQINDNAGLVIELKGHRRTGRAGFPWGGLFLLVVLVFGGTRLARPGAERDA